MRSRVPLALAICLTFAACGGGGDKPAETAEPASKPATDSRRAPPRLKYAPEGHPGSRAAVGVIRAWSDELRRGHVTKASSYFSLPTIVSQGGTPLTLRTRVQARLFNASLPCGAKLKRTLAGPRYTIATFELTERVGSATGCDGTGNLAATAFAFRHGKISEWRRVTVPPVPPVA